MTERPQHRRTKPFPPATRSPHHAIDVILYDQTSLEPDADIEEVAQDAMARVFKTAMDEFVGDRQTYGNEAGLRLLQRLGEMSQPIVVLERDVTRIPTLE